MSHLVKKGGKIQKTIRQDPKVLPFNLIKWLYFSQLIDLILFLVEEEIIFGRVIGPDVFD